MMRVTNLKEVEQKVVGGSEPDLSKGESIAAALNWYSYYKDSKDSKKYLLHYMKINQYSKTDIEKVSKVPDTFILNTGFVCRLIERGAILTETNINWIKSKIAYFISIVDKPKDDSENTKPKPNIQDRINEQTDGIIGELEGFVDSYKTTFNPYEWMLTNGVKSVHARKIELHFKEKLIEPKIVLDGNADDDLKEGYSCYTKVELKKYINFIESISNDAQRIVSNSKVARKPKIKKAPTADKLALKLKYMKESVEYKLKSINPSEIVGAKQLWVFNTKTRKLGVYYAWTDGGLTIKGTTIHGFTDNSCTKTLRKPDDVLQAISKSSERKYKSIFDEIKSTEQPLTGRINTDIILLKVFK